MYEQEKQRSLHLTILIYKTFFLIGWTCTAIFLKWDTWVIILCLLGLVACWLLHITEKLPGSIRLWIYFIFTMLSFFYFGIHEIVIVDMAPCMVLFIFMYTLTEKHSFVRICALTYYLTMCYDFVFVLGNPLKLPMYTMFRLIFHCAFVFLAERLAEKKIQRHKDERKKMDEKISKLEEANRRVEDFMANMSHELRTPINAVIGITTVMLKNEEDSEKMKDILSIRMAGHRLFSQIEDILDYTEVDTGKVIVSEENYMVLSLVNDIIIENRLMKKEKELELIFDIDAGIPSLLFGDGKKIKKIMKHLIDNAVKFTKEGGVYIRVYALKKAYGINLCIKISDTGDGIAEEELGKIKERFFQSNAGRNRKAGGLGLGLPIVYGMVTAMGGFMQIESAEGSGTTVSLSIPQKVADTAPSMEVLNRENLSIALYLRPEKYEFPEIRDYYNTVITHMIQELNLTIHRVFNLGELKKLNDMYQLTHLVIGEEEYEENTSYYEELNKDMDVIVVADEYFLPVKNSRVKHVQKPFYGLPIVNILNSNSSSKIDIYDQVNMVCPGVRVLVVDDEPMNLMVAEGIFKDYQMKVKTAGSGMAAIELCEKEEFDLIFLDHMMPEMDGVETLKRLRKVQLNIGKTFTIIAFTANAVSGAREMLLQEGFDDFISKPVEEQDFKRLLRRVLPKTAIVYLKENERKELSIKEPESEALQSATDQADVQKPALKNDQIEDKLFLLEEKGFHTGAGLQHCRGDREFYEKVLTQFAKDAKRKMADIEDSFGKEDIKNYQIMVHALKSSSKMIGADTLSDMAKDAEEAAKNQNVAYIKEHHEEILSKYRETVQHIVDVLGSAEEIVEKEDSAVSEEISKEELIKHLSDLKNSLDTFEADKAETLLAEMNGLAYQGTQINALLRDVRQDVEDFELNAASEKVEELIHNIEGGGA